MIWDEKLWKDRHKGAKDLQATKIGQWRKPKTRRQRRWNKIAWLQRSLGQRGWQKVHYFLAFLRLFSFVHFQILHHFGGAAIIIILFHEVPLLLPCSLDSHFTDTRSSVFLLHNLSLTSLIPGSLTIVFFNWSLSFHFKFLFSPSRYLSEFHADHVFSRPWFLTNWNSSRGTKSAERLHCTRHRRICIFQISPSSYGRRGYWGSPATEGTDSRVTSRDTPKDIN